MIMGGDCTQDYTNEKTIALATRTGKMTASVMKAMLTKYLAAQKNKSLTKRMEQRSGTSYLGKTTLRKLQKQGDKLSNIEITDQNIKSFEKVARKYDLTFALKKDSTQEPPKYIVFFRGRDADTIQQAFMEYTRLEQKLDKKPSIRKRLAKALKKTLENTPMKQKERSKKKEQDVSL